MKWQGKSGTHYETQQMNSADAKRISADAYKTAERREGEDKERALRRASDYADLAQRLATQESEYETQKKLHRRQATANTKNQKDSFTAQYGNSEERDAARKRIDKRHTYFS